MSRLWIDSRYTGHHGIARYSQEVTKRMELEHCKLPVSRSPTSPFGLLERGWRVPPENDVIYSPGFGTGLSSARQLLTIHDLIHLGGSGRKALAQKVYYERAVKPAIEKAGHVLTVSETSATALRDWLGPNAPVIVHNTGNGCSEDFVAEGPAFNHPRPYLLFVGNSKDHKNPAIAVEALKYLPDFDLIVVSQDRDRFNELASSANILDRISVVSGLDDQTLATYYRGATALIFPSLLEGFGLPALESIRCGTPVVYYAGCHSVAEIVGHNGHAFHDPHDAQELATQAVAASELRVTFDRKMASFDWDVVTLKVTEVISDFQRAI